MDKYAVIVAGGAGVRMGGHVPKQFLPLNGRPLLYYTLNTFIRAFDDLELILVLPENYIEMGKEIIDGYFDSKRIKITAGGETRFQSVKNGLQFVKEESIIFVHDGVRCLVSESLVKKCYEEALRTGSAIPVITSRDSVRILNEDDTNNPLDRNRVLLVQTPQTFHSKILLPAYEIDYKEWFTDEANVVEAFGLKVNLVIGEENNIKITQPIDIVIAEKILTDRGGVGD